MEGWRVGPREILEKLEDPTQIDEVDPKTYSFRVYVHMETGDARYLHLNTGMWIGSGVRRGTEGRSAKISVAGSITNLLPWKSSTIRIALSELHVILRKATSCYLLGLQQNAGSLFRRQVQRYG